ncbi:MAG: RNA polymerase sigma factor [Planctomycetota bacterium]|nr:RNA polymerase sigma factor [Planctomycetota bacterium]
MNQALTESRLRHWMQELGPRLIRLSAGICRDAHQAEEIVQEAFVKLWKQPPEVGEVAYLSWMRRVVTNLSINALQRTKRPGTLPEFSSDPALRCRDDSDHRREMQEDLNLVRQGMEDLDESKRAILMLRAQEQLSYEEIAQHLGIPVGTVMSRLNRARTALLEAMKQQRDETDANPMVFEFRKYKQA